MEKIDIDWDIHKLIEAERRGFDEPPYLALRRLLNLPENENKPVIAETGDPWKEQRVTVPHGADARMIYRGKTYEGRFLNGQLHTGGRAFERLSPAAHFVATTKSGKKPSLNGWNYWEVRFPGDTDWRSLKTMRDDARPKISFDMSLLSLTPKT